MHNSVGIEVLNDMNIKTACDGEQQYPIRTLTLENYGDKKEWTNHSHPHTGTEDKLLKLFISINTKHGQAKYSLKIQNQAADQMGYCQLGQCNHWPLTDTFSVIN